ncbi:DEAD/DEAH box helicase [Lactobacillus delbrueckii subsp. bulgaricus]
MELSPLSPPRLVSNQQENIWQTLRRQLLTCQSFTWAVAFITADMLPPFKLVMEDLQASGVRGTIITGTYLAFNQPRVFAELLKISNLTVRIVDGPFHAKGYLFDHGDWQTAVIGSANFTRSALLANQEWCLKVDSQTDSALPRQLAAALADLTGKSQPLTYTWLADYEKSWQPPAKPVLHVKQEKIVPNQMQAAALENLQALVKSGARRALVVSATGTGKTYLAALAVKDFVPRRFLYLVHREEIARKALETFKKVIGGKDSDFALLTGTSHQQARYTFATIQTVSQDQFLASQAADFYDYILIDEAHRSAAPSYQKVLSHFSPAFCLGLTATPERMDQQDIFALFDYNLAYEIRLADALESKMLTPFHYIGIRDYEIDGQTSDDFSDLRWLGAKKRVSYLLKELDYYGYSGPRPCGLVFCSRQEEARQLAEAFTQQGQPAQALTNQDSPAVRRQAVKDLESGRLHYLVTVDLFNEGVDIPALNQIVMLRAAQSATVFIQQLGRGLRLYPGQDFVTVLDFIGNYQNNYLIPLALAGKKLSRDQLKYQLQTVSFAGLSTINFSRIASQEILASLDKVKLDSLKQLREAYADLAQQLGRAPLLLDFAKKGQVSPRLWLDNKSLPHYGAFLKKMGQPCQLSSYESQVLSFVTKELAPGQRPHELLLLQALLPKGQISQTDFQALLKNYGAYDSPALEKSLEAILSLDFYDVKSGSTSQKAKYGGEPVACLKDGCWSLNPQIVQASPDFLRLFKDAVETGLFLAKEKDPTQDFTLYAAYDRKEVCRLLNWPLDVSRPMYGYRLSGNVCPVFITYQKTDQEQRNARYDNQARGQRLAWYTRTPRHLSSPEVQQLLRGTESGQQVTRIPVFVKRADAYGPKFYYLGSAKIDPATVREVNLKGKSAVGLDLVLPDPLPAKIADQLFSN